MSRDLEIDLLRAFVAVATHRNFTHAAAAIGRTQSAMSMQVKRLEEIVDLTLFDRSNKSVALTADGETLLGYANRLLLLNDETLSRLREPAADGLVRIGAPDDYATYLLPQVLASFSKLYPRVQVEVICDNSPDLLRLLDRGQLDIVFATHPLDDISGEVIRRETLHWLAAPGFHHDSEQPLPLVMWPQGCACRDLALRALEKSDLTWRIAFTARSTAVIHSAVASGSGVTVAEASTIPADFEILDGSPGFPDIQDIVISLHRNTKALSPAITLAADHISREFKTSNIY